MATNKAEEKLYELSDRLESHLERQQLKGSDWVTLSSQEVKELLEGMRDAGCEIDALINGSP